MTQDAHTANSHQLINSMTGAQLEVYDDGENCARPVQLGNEIEWNSQAITLIDTPGLDVSKRHLIMKEIFDILKYVLLFIFGRKLSG